MLRYILKRLLQGVFVLIGVSIVIFCLSRIIPGDPARLALGQHATQEAVDNLSKQMYLDKPLPVQYILWFRDVLHGDFGISLSTRRSVTEDMKQLLPATFELIFWSALFMVGGSLILGRAAARHRDGFWTVSSVCSPISESRCRPSWWQLCCWSYSEIYGR